MAETDLGILADWDVGDDAEEATAAAPTAAELEGVVLRLV